MKNVLAQSLIDSVSSALVGKREAAELAVTALLAGGHLLLEDVPGVGKTTLSLAIAASLGCTFGRIQFTPDTMPSDVFGVSIYDSVSGQFKYKPGVIMKNIILADEINRTPPKTQSALLEAMEEHQVTVDGVSYPLPEPFFVAATQNPIEHSGTYPLPEAQLDRFIMRISIGYPERDDEEMMISRAIAGERAGTPKAVMQPEQLLELQQEVRQVTVCREVIGYITELVGLTRTSEDLLLGASPRAAIALTRAAQATAYIDGRDYVAPDDVKRVFIPVMAHRVVASAKARAAGHDARWIISRIRNSVTVPVL
ncbi:MAG: MoxR family ATPase [Ruminococcaceae bacterium]|nr:MoxR family ATPase [Oscillospiraceae bacterium]